MARETKISWAHGTFNPWRGCTKVSEACRHCYAEGWAKRTGKPIWGKDAAREHASESYWQQPTRWNLDLEVERVKNPGAQFRVFCSSLADVCEDRDDLLEPRARLMRLIEATPALTWLLCTKRPENFVRFFGRRWGANWPKNVWALTTAEDQANADKRIPELLRVPAVIRGVSYEPALGPVNFRPYLAAPCTCPDPHPHPHLAECPAARRWVNWVIVGGESGHGARPFDIAWARGVKQQCIDTGSAFFMKQLGALVISDGITGPGQGWPIGHCRRETGRGNWQELVKSKKGDDPSEWPSDLQVQEFPRAG